jgi:AraC family transcriptional regulator
MYKAEGFNGIDLMQADGGPPAVLASGSAPGESGVSVARVRFHERAHLRAAAQQHLIFFQVGDCMAGSRPGMECRMDSRRLEHAPPAGSLAIAPAGVDAAAEAHYSLDTIVVAVAPKAFALAAAEDSALEARLIERLFGSDVALFGLASRMASESRASYPNGPLFWNDVAGAFIEGLRARHATAPLPKVRGRLNGRDFARITDYIFAHLPESIEVATLADLVGRSPFHFSRVFTQSVGMTPHRYVVHLRLRRAFEMARSRSANLAAIAAATGFADQSHLSRWVRRVYGVSVSELASPPPDAEQQESSRPADARLSH